MSTEPVQLERRGAQRFDFHLPVSVRSSDSQEGSGFTQNLSARGAFLYTEFPVAEDCSVELTLVMPSEITLAESMRVRCRGKVTRINRPATGSKCGVAVHLEGYEFLPEAPAATEAASTFNRIAALHEHGHESAAPAIPPSDPLR